jgi:alanine racemase
MLPLRPTTLEIDLDAAAGNIRAVRRLVGAQRKIYAVVKADGYGYGAAEMGAVFLANGADALGIADLGEGVRLRRRGITAPVLVYPNSLPEAAPVTLAHGLTPTLVDLDGARAYSAAASGPCDVFVKIDVGLERLGVPAEQAVKTVAAMMELPRLRLAGLCAHPHDSAGGDPAYAEWQLGRYTAIVDELEARGIPVPVRLFAASPVLKFQTYLNAVDPGRTLYGITFPGDLAGAACADAPPLPAGHCAHELHPRALRREGTVSRDSADAAGRHPDGCGGRPRPAPRRPRARARAFSSNRVRAEYRAHAH